MPTLTHFCFHSGHHYLLLSASGFLKTTVLFAEQIRVWTVRQHHLPGPGQPFL